jgi:hypothetical protein
MKMKAKLFCLILILALSLVALPEAAQADNMIFNPSFENGTWTSEADWPEDWLGWEPGGYHRWTDDDAYEGIYSFAQAGQGGTLLAMTFPRATVSGPPIDIPIDDSKQYYFHIFAKGAGGVFDAKVEWYDVDLGETIVGESVFPNNYTTSEWQDFGFGPMTPPAGTLFARPCLFNWNDAEVFYDSAWLDIEKRKVVSTDPVPEDGAAVMPTLAELRWRKPSTLCPGTHPVTCDIYLDPNEFLVEHMDPAVKLNLTPQEPNWIALDPCDVLVDTNYYWRVVSFDPNCGYGNDGENPVVGIGYIWRFTTINLGPLVDATPNRSVWLSGGLASITLNGTITDDGLPIPPGSVSYTWSKTSGPALVSNSNPSGTVPPNGRVPTTVEFDTAGIYVLTLEGNDDKNNASGGLGKTGSDTVTIYVYTEGDLGLIAHWPFDTNYNDIVGGHNGTAQGDASIDSGDKQKGSGSLVLDGSGDYVDCGGGTTDPNYTTWASPLDPNLMSVTCWIKAAENNWGGSWAGLVHKSTLAWGLRRDADSDDVEFLVNGFSSAISGAAPALAAIDDGQWHHIAGVCVGDAIYLYVDAVPAAYSIGPDEESIHGGHDLWIGKGYDPDYPASGYEFKGHIDEVRLYGYPLNSTQVLAEYVADGGGDSCGGRYHVLDLTNDCYVTLADFAEFAKNWLTCNDIGGSCQASP